MTYKRVRHHSRCGDNAIHLIQTEAKTLDEALDVIRARQLSKKLKERHVPQTLRQIFATANNNAKFTKWKKEHTPVKPPHPFRDLPEDQKPAKMRELYYSKAWGFGVKAHRDLSKQFGVSYDQAVEWIDDKVHSEYAEDENYLTLTYEARERYRRLNKFRETSKRK